MMPRILVIDDDPAISELVAINLEMAGYEVSQAEDGIKGQALAMQLLPDLIILDLMLPKVDGFTICQRLRRDETHGRYSGVDVNGIGTNPKQS